MERERRHSPAEDELYAIETLDCVEPEITGTIATVRKLKCMMDDPENFPVRTRLREMMDERIARLGSSEDDLKQYVAVLLAHAYIKESDNQDQLAA